MVIVPSNHVFSNNCFLETQALDLFVKLPEGAQRHKSSILFIATYKFNIISS